MVRELTYSFKLYHYQLIVDLAIGDVEDQKMSRGDHKNPAAVELGRWVGFEAERRGQENLCQQKRSDIARKAAQARYGKKSD